jgi:hypothetical protein
MSRISSSPLSFSKRRKLSGTASMWVSAFFFTCPSIKGRRENTRSLVRR